MKLNLTIVGKSMQDIRNAMNVFMVEFNDNKLDKNCNWPLNDGRETEIDYDFTDGIDVFNKSMAGEERVYPYQGEEWWEELRKEVIPKKSINFNSGEVFNLYQRDIFNEKEQIYRGKWKYISWDGDEDIIFENEKNEQSLFPLWQINNGFWRFDAID